MSRSFAEHLVRDSENYQKQNTFQRTDFLILPKIPAYYLYLRFGRKFSKFLYGQLNLLYSSQRWQPFLLQHHLTTVHCHYR